MIALLIQTHCLPLTLPYSIGITLLPLAKTKLPPDVSVIVPVKVLSPASAESNFILLNW